MWDSFYRFQWFAPAEILAPCAISGSGLHPPNSKVLFRKLGIINDVLRQVLKLHQKVNKKLPWITRNIFISFTWNEAETCLFISKKGTKWPIPPSKCNMCGHSAPLFGKQAFQLAFTFSVAITVKPAWSCVFKTLHWVISFEQTDYKCTWSRKHKILYGKSLNG